MLVVSHENFESLINDFNGMLIDKSFHGKSLHRTYLIDLNAPAGDEDNERSAVVKCFGPRSGKFNVLLRSAGNFFTGRTSVGTWRRFKTERRAINVWRRFGFGTFNIIHDLPEQFQDKPWLVTEFADGVKLDQFLADQSVGQPRKDQVLTKFWEETAKRHRLALQNRKRFLIPSNPNLKHVMLMPGDKFLTFDFEVAFVRFASVKTLIGRELTGYVRSMRNFLNTEQFNHSLKVMVQVYPEPSFLNYVKRVDKSLNPLIRICQVISKYAGPKDRGDKLNAAKIIMQTKKEALCK